MDLEYGPEYEALRREVRAFLDEHWSASDGARSVEAELQERDFRSRAIDAGWLHRSIPREYGGGERPTDPFVEAIIRGEFRAAGAPHVVPGIGPAMLAPTLLEEGTRAQCQRFIPPTLRGDILWCQGYSEPGSGSDLASLQARAELQGDDWVIHGQKIWTSGAAEADWMFGLFRTEAEAPRHAGISYLLVPMRQPGIEVRPLEMMTGGAEFNEVFFEGARTAADCMVGNRGEGWRVSRATLKHERNLIGDAATLVDAFDALVELARSVVRDGRPAIHDPGIRQRLVEVEGYVAAQDWSLRRQMSAIARDRDMDVLRPVMMNKLHATDTMKRLCELAYDLLGQEGWRAPAPKVMTRRDRQRSAPEWIAEWMFSLATSIAGGTSNIQRNLIGERLLGLPRDLRRPAR